MRGQECVLARYMDSRPCCCGHPFEGVLRNRHRNRHIQIDGSSCTKTLSIFFHCYEHDGKLTYYYMETLE